MKIVLSHNRIRVSSSSDRDEGFPIELKLHGKQLHLTRQECEDLESLLRLARTATRSDDLSRSEL